MMMSHPPGTITIGTGNDVVCHLARNGVNLRQELKPRVTCDPSQSFLTSVGRFFRRLGRPSSRIDVAISLVEVNHAVQFGSLEILTPDGLLLLVRGFDACRF